MPNICYHKCFLAFAVCIFMGHSFFSMSSYCWYSQITVSAQASVPHSLVLTETTHSLFRSLKKALLISAVWGSFHFCSSQVITTSLYTVIYYKQVQQFFGSNFPAFDDYIIADGMSYIKLSLIHVQSSGDMVLFQQDQHCYTLHYNLYYLYGQTTQIVDASKAHRFSKSNICSHVIGWIQPLFLSLQLGLTPKATLMYL